MHLDKDLISHNEIQYYRNAAKMRMLSIFVECLASINQVLSDEKNPEIHKTLTEAHKTWSNIYKDLLR